MAVELGVESSERGDLDETAGQEDALQVLYREIEKRQTE